MKKISGKKIRVFQEILSKIDSLISPVVVDYRLKKLMNKDTSSGLFDKNPRCFLYMNIGGRSVPFPVCNRSGIQDPRIVAISLKAARKFATRPDIDVEEMRITLDKLESLHDKLLRSFNNIDVHEKPTKELEHIKRLLHR